MSIVSAGSENLSLKINSAFVQKLDPPFLHAVMLTIYSPFKGSISKAPSLRLHVQTTISDNLLLFLSLSSLPLLLSASLFCSVTTCPFLHTTFPHALLFFSFFSLTSPSSHSFFFTVHPPTPLLYSFHSFLLSFHQPAPPIPPLVESPPVAPCYQLALNW